MTTAFPTTKRRDSHSNSEKHTIASIINQLQTMWGFNDGNGNTIDDANNDPNDDVDNNDANNDVVKNDEVSKKASHVDRTFPADHLIWKKFGFSKII